MLQKVDLKSEKLDFFVGMKKSSPTHLLVCLSLRHVYDNVLFCRLFWHGALIHVCERRLLWCLLRAAKRACNHSQTVACQKPGCAGRGHPPQEWPQHPDPNRLQHTKHLGLGGALWTKSQVQVTTGARIVLSSCKRMTTQIEFAIGCSLTLSFVRTSSFAPGHKGADRS